LSSAKTTRAAQPARKNASTDGALSRSRYALFLAITVLAPFLILAAIEVTIRVANPGGGLPLFVDAQFVNGDYLVANPRIGSRWFAGVEKPPAAAPELFARQKPANGFRVFVLGESAAAGFPYPRNVTFSRLVRDALRDALPNDSVEVANLAIAATNSFAMLDIAKEVAEQHPDAVLIYAGHNEYYGALGAASRINVPGGAAIERLYLKLLRLRTVLALRNLFVALRSSGKTSDPSLEAASLMEVLARDRQVPLGSPLYGRGIKQFEDNLDAIIHVFERNRVPVFVASVASNLRDQPPFAADANARAGGADSVFQLARATLGRGDTTQALKLYSSARDMDVVRFRAPGTFNEVIQRVAARNGATYVPVAEAFAAASPGRIPGANLFLEHVHPTREGQALIGQVFFDALLKGNLFGNGADTSRVRPWIEYVRDQAVTPFDERIAFHTTRTLTLRWPFVPVTRQVDYRGTYVPTDLLDSLAFAVSRGDRWEVAKLNLAAAYEKRHQYDSAAAEYAGLARDAPLLEEPNRLLARALALAGRSSQADTALRKAGIAPTAQSLAALARIAAQRRNIPEAISLYQRSLALEPKQPDALYQLSLTYGLARDLPNAQKTAIQLARVAPDYPGLPELLSTLGLGRQPAARSPAPKGSKR
jgi:tetratricopeptide (TPR) repeat protein